MVCTRGNCRCPRSWHSGLGGARPRHQIVVTFLKGKLTVSEKNSLDATRANVQTCYFSSKETRTFSDDKRWRADDENQSFHIRKATLLIGQDPAMLRELARGRPICCTCYFPTTKSHMSWPCAPLRDETSARRNGGARGAMRKTIAF